MKDFVILEEIIPNIKPSTKYLLRTDYVPGILLRHGESNK